MQIVAFSSKFHIQVGKILKKFLMGVKLQKIWRKLTFFKTSPCPLGGELNWRVFYINCQVLWFLIRWSAKYLPLLFIGVIFHFLRIFFWFGPPTHYRNYRSVGIEIRCFWIAQMKEDKICFPKMKKWGGRWGSEQGQISLWSFRCSKFPILSIFWVWHVINLKFSQEIKNIWVYIPNSSCF